MQSSRIAQPNLGHPRQQTHNRSCTQSSSAIHGNVGSLQRMAELLCVRDRSWLLCCGWPNCFACAIDRGFVDADDRAALHARSIVGLLPRMTEVLCVRDRSWVCCRGWPRFGCAIPEDCVRIRGLRSKKLVCVCDRSWVCCRRWPRFGCTIPEDCMRIRSLHSKSSDPRFACAILGLLRKSSDPRFAQQNPRMVRIRTLRITYILGIECVCQKNVRLHVFTDCAKFLRALKYCVPIIEWVDSISRDERAAPLTQYITNAGITRARYTITHFKHHQRVLRLQSKECITSSYNAILCTHRATRIKNHDLAFFFFFLLILLLFSSVDLAR